MVFQSDYVVFISFLWLRIPTVSSHLISVSSVNPSRTVSLSVLFAFLMANDTKHCLCNLLDFM